MNTKLLALLVLSLFLSALSYADSSADSALNQTMSDMISELLIGGVNQGYQPSADQHLHHDIQAASNLLNKGANPNVYVPDSLNFLKIYNLNAFDASILLSGLMWNSALTEAFINHGASATAPDANGWLPMDYAVLSFWKNQTDSVSEIKSGLKIIELLQAHGAKISDATHLDGIPHFQTYQDLAQTVLAMKIMAQEGLIPEQAFEDAAIGPASVRANLDKMTTIDESLLRSNGAYFRNLKAGTIDRDDITSLKAPSFYNGRTKVSLILAEPNGWEKHNENTFLIATGTAQDVNPAADFTQFFSLDSMLDIYTDDANPAHISNALKFLLNLNGSPLQNRVVFNSSDGLDLPRDTASIVREGLNADSFDYQTALLFQQYLEAGKPIVFQAAGNGYLEEGNFMNNWGIINGPRTALIGAVARYATKDNVHGKFVVFPESATGADLCAPLPKIDGKLMLGTSCSTPVISAVFRQFAEWYGSKLSYDEIIAAALLTADKDILAFSDPYGAFNAILNGKPIADLKTEPADLGIEAQCGAGVMNEVNWQKALDWMSQNKTQSTPSVSQIVPLKKIDDGVYAAVIPHAITSSRLTFYLPQAVNHHSDIFVQTPSHPDVQLPLTATEVLSTFAFANQDLKAGDKIIVNASEPLLNSAGIVVRGEPDDNVIQKLRDHLAQTRR